MTIPGIVTSDARPVDPNIGDRIFETDTGRILYWYGPYYKWLPQWGAGGRLLNSIEGNVFVDSTAGDALSLTVPFLQLQARKVYWVANFPINRASGVTAIYQITDGNNVVLCNRQLSVSTAAALQHSVTMYYREIISPTQQVDVTRKLRVAAGSIPSGSKYNMFCFDEGFGVSMTGNIPTWDNAIWDLDLWGS